METTLDVVEGCSSTAATSRPISSPMPSHGSVMEDALILINEKKISNMKDLCLCSSRWPSGKPLLMCPRT